MAVLAAGVALVHLVALDEVLEDQLGAGAGPQPPRRIEVAFVRELQQERPAAQLAAPLRRAVRRALPALAAAPAASAPVIPPVSELVAAMAPLPLLPPPEPPSAAFPPAPQASSPPGTPATTAEAVPLLPTTPAVQQAARRFDWPPSTRLSYRLTGYYRGPVEGSAQVEWVRDGRRYQVHLDVAIALITRRMSSDGTISADGLHPSRYDEVTRVPLRAPRVVTLLFDDTRIRLANGNEVLRPSGVQDTASQFVQMTWMFTLDPSRLEPGRSFVLPLALPRRVEDWVYDIVARQTLTTPAGEVDTVHVKPRREPRPGGDLTAEMWIAPSLQYLPVRIVIRQDAETYADLLIERLPQQAAPEAAASAPAGR